MQNNIGQSSGPPNLDINVLPVWSKGISGKGVVVAILDDGMLIIESFLIEKVIDGIQCFKNIYLKLFNYPELCTLSPFHSK